MPSIRPALVQVVGFEPTSSSPQTELNHSPACKNPAVFSLLEKTAGVYFFKIFQSSFLYHRKFAYSPGYWMLGGVCIRVKCPRARRGQDLAYPGVCEHTYAHAHAYA